MLGCGWVDLRVLLRLFLDPNDFWLLEDFCLLLFFLLRAQLMLLQLDFVLFGLSKIGARVSKCGFAVLMSISMIGLILVIGFTRLNLMEPM